MGPAKPRKQCLLLIVWLFRRLMVTRFDSQSVLRASSMEKESSDSDNWEDPPVCQRMGVMTAFESFDTLSEYVVWLSYINVRVCVCVCACACVCVFVCICIWKREGKRNWQTNRWTAGERQRERERERDTHTHTHTDRWQRLKGRNKTARGRERQRQRRMHVKTDKMHKDV